MKARIFLIRVLALTVPLAAASAWLHPAEDRSRSWSLLRSEYRLFLLEGMKAQGLGLSLFATPETLSPEALRASATVGHLILARARPNTWSEDAVRDLSRMIVSQSEEFGLSPLLVLSLIDVESRFDPKAISPVGARGLLQLMPATAAELAASLGLPWSGEADLEDPALNLRLGLSYYKVLQSRYQNPEHVFAAYNMGPGALNRKLANGEEVSRVYYEKVMSAMQAYRRKARDPKVVPVHAPAPQKGRISWL